MVSFLKRLFHIHDWLVIEKAVILDNGAIIPHEGVDWHYDTIIYDRICRKCEKTEFKASEGLKKHKQTIKPILEEERKQKKALEEQLTEKFNKLKKLKEMANE